MLTIEYSATDIKDSIISKENKQEITIEEKIILLWNKERFKYCLDNLIMIIKCMSIKVK